MSFDELTRASLVVVSGKGGTGKTTVAAAIALGAAWQGRSVLLCEVEGRQGIAEALDLEDLGYRERDLGDIGAPGELTALTVDPDHALREYLARYGAGPLARLLSWAQLTRLITTAAPGLRDILLIGKVWESATGRGDHRPDLVVLDAPPTGRLLPFLRAPRSVADLARVGPIRGQAARIEQLLNDPQATQVVLVTLAEELPVGEAVEAATALEEAGLHLGSLVVNRLLPAWATRPIQASADALRAAAQGADVPLNPMILASMLEQARAGEEVGIRQRGLVHHLATTLTAPVWELEDLCPRHDKQRKDVPLAVAAARALSGSSSPAQGGGASRRRTAKETG